MLFPNTSIKGFLYFVENAKSLLFKELFVIVGVGWEWEGSVIDVRLYLVSIIKFPLIFCPANVDATIVQNEVLTGK